VNTRATPLLATILAALLLLGFAARSTPEESRGALLIHSTIGGASAFLFVVDPVTRNLAAYEATPGENGGLRLLGARKIQHDLELKKYRDLSAYSAEELEKLKGAIEADAGAAAKEGRSGG
jgi:hypothetical protein